MNKHVKNTKNITDLCRLLSSTTRCAILTLLLKNDQVCVKDIADEIGASHSATSHQLAKLEKAGVVRCSRKGKTMCYSFSSSKEAKQVQGVLQKLS